MKMSLQGGTTGCQPGLRNQILPQQGALAPAANVSPGPNTEQPRITRIVLPVPPSPRQRQKLSDKIPNSQSPRKLL